jgi:hypothetical protein
MAPTTDKPASATLARPSLGDSHTRISPIFDAIKAWVSIADKGHERSAGGSMASWSSAPRMHAPSADSQMGLIGDIRATS